MSNPGPAVTTTVNTQAVTAPIQTPASQTNAGPVQGTNARRLIAAARGLNLAATGDQAIIPVINTLYFTVSDILVANGQVSGAAAAITTAGIGIWTSAAKAGTTVMASIALTTNSAADSVWAATVSTAASATAIKATVYPSLYFNVNTSLASATCDVFVYGYDLS